MQIAFIGPYRFLSNFYPTSITVDGIIYPTLEHAYQAMKTLDRVERVRISLLPRPGQARRVGNKLRLRKGWEKMKVSVMTDLLQKKFEVQVLKNLLLSTRTAELVEINDWGDTFWGVCNGRGKNVLGTLLMDLRSQLE